MTATVGQARHVTKPSGVEWIGDIPDEWEVVLLRLVARIESGHTPSRSHPEYWVPSECVVPWFSLADIWQLRDGKQKYLGETAEQVSPLGLANSSARVLPAKTVVLSRTASVGYSGLMPSPMATTQDFVNWVCGPRIKPEFLLWVFRAMKPEFDRLMRGSTHQTIYMPDVRQFQGPLPPLPTQRAIAAYLDRKTAAIDSLIEKKQKLLDLLAEKRAALINQAVTKGLDPNVPMKDSGVPWIGEIPAHWEVKRVRHAVRITNTNRLPISRAERALRQGEFPYWGPTGVLDHINEYRFEGAVALIGEDGDHFTKHLTWSMTQWAEGQFNVNNHAHAIASGGGCSARWFYWSFRHRDIGGDLVAQGVSRLKLTRWSLSNLRLPIPSGSEQEAICTFLDKAVERAGASETAVHDQLDRLREYRQALITAAVTGQLDIGEDAA